MTARMLFVLALGACTAKTISPPLTARGSPDPRHTFANVQLTSGTFLQPHVVIGVIQMTQTGYKLLHEIELVDDARPESLLFKIGELANKHGAHGVQHLIVTDLDPQTPADNANRKIESTIAIADAIEKGQPARAAGEGTKTRWEIRGELIQFIDPGAPAP